MVEDNYSGESKSIWNFDRDRMMVLSFFMRSYQDASPTWDLKNMYEALRSVRRTIFGICKEDNKTALKEAFDKLETKKRELDLASNNEIIQKRIEFYNLQEETFDLINEVNKDEGFSFNTKDDEDGL